MELLGGKITFNLSVSNVGFFFKIEGEALSLGIAEVLFLLIS